MKKFNPDFLGNMDAFAETFVANGGDVPPAPATKHIISEIEKESMSLVGYTVTQLDADEAYTKDLITEKGFTPGLALA